MRRAALTGMVLLAAAAGGFARAQDGSEPVGGIPRAVEVARTTAIPDCSTFVDAAAGQSGDGSAAAPHSTIAAAIEAAEPGAIICVAEGVYSEELQPGVKPFTLAGGFQSGSNFEVRDSAAYVSKAQGNGGGSFIRIEDPGPKDQLTAIDGFEITGYSQAIFRDYWESQRFDITNNNIHDNTCADGSLWGAGFALNNVTGTIGSNVIRNNSCGRGGGGFLNDDTNQNSVVFERNLVDGNAGTEASSSHGGGLFIGANTLSVIGNEIINNTVTQWGGGLYIGAYTQGNQLTTATLAWNIYRGNRAGDSGGGFFCDEGAVCIASHEIYDGNCGGNILLDGGAEGSGPTRATFDHITNVGALNVGCGAPGMGVWVDTWEGYAADTYSFTNAIFWGNAPEQDIVTSCGSGCAAIKVDISQSLLQEKITAGGIDVTFGPGIVASRDPLFVDAEAGDFRLQPDSPLAGTELGAFGGVDGTEAPAQSAEREPEAARPVVAEEPDPTPAAEAASAAAEAESGPAGIGPVAQAGASDLTAKQAFDDAKALGTAEAWQAFLAYYPSGFHADLARAYLKSLGAEAAAAPLPDEGATAAASDAAAEDEGADEGAAPSGAAENAGPGVPAVARGGDYMGFPERFNRYYTDPEWEPSQTLYVSPQGGGDGTSRESPISPSEAVAAATPGTQISFAPGSYAGCFEFRAETSGTYDDPIVLYGERNADRSLGVSMACCTSGRKSCFNFENANYIALDGFQLTGGNFGVRAVGADYPASQHSRGVAVLNSVGLDQERDPFFTGQSDWAVFEGNTGGRAGDADGHGIYISNGSDWNIVRFNETFSGTSSDFQINADPTSTCADVGIPFDDPRCDAYAGEGEGGQGASDYFLVEGNYFHHSLGPGANFTSVRRSIVRNNIFGPQARHNVTFWQETDNPKLGSSDNKILHNLFITTQRHGIKFEANSTRNEFANNLILGVAVEGGEATANPDALLMEVDGTVGENTYRSNLYVSGRIEGRRPGNEETFVEDFSSAWFTGFPTDAEARPDGFAPTPEAPFLGMGVFSPDAPFDRNGVPRRDPVDPGPIELP